MAWMEYAERSTEGTAVLEDNVLAIYSTPDEIKEAILSDEDFSIDALVSDKETAGDADAYYDFSPFGKYQIAEWACEAGAITETEAIECLRDLIIDKNFENIDCLEGAMVRIRDFAESGVSEKELSDKIDCVLNPLSNSAQSRNNHISLTSITQEAAYTHSYFTIYYDSGVGSKAEITRSLEGTCVISLSTGRIIWAWPLPIRIPATTWP